MFSRKEQWKACPLASFYGQKFLGVDPQTGDALFLGEDGKPTTDFDNAKMVTLGNSNPKWTGGFTNTFSYKGFDLNIFFMGVFGNKVNNAAGYFMSDGFYNGLDNQTTDILNAWQKPGDKTNVPRIGYFLWLRLSKLFFPVALQWFLCKVKRCKARL